MGIFKRKRNKKNKLRGHRTHGVGNTKNRRGSGCQGGVGRAGSSKHKKMPLAYDFGKHGFVRKNTAQYIRIDLNALNKMALQGKTNFDFDNKTKILGDGVIEVAVTIKNAKATEKAKQKIIQAGGQIE